MRFQKIGLFRMTTGQSAAFLPLLCVSMFLMMQWNKTGLGSAIIWAAGHAVLSSLLALAILNLLALVRHKRAPARR